MEEDIADSLLTTANVLHWFGQHRVGNAVILLSRLLRVSNVHSLDELERFVETKESEAIK